MSSCSPPDRTPHVFGTALLNSASWLSAASTAISCCSAMLAAGRHLQKWVGAPSGPSNRKLNPQLSRYVFASRPNGGLPPQFFSSTIRDQSDPCTAGPYPPAPPPAPANSPRTSFHPRATKL